MENLELDELKAKLIELAEALKLKNVLSEADLHWLRSKIYYYADDMECLKHYWRHIDSLYDPIGI